MSTPAPAPDPNAVQLPNKLYFRMGEVSRLTGLKPHVLRYWETEFSIISPRKTGREHRLYRRKDVETLLEIKRLLYDKRFTIEGARKALADRSTTPSLPKAAPRPATRRKLEAPLPVPTFAVSAPVQASLFGIDPGEVDTRMQRIKDELRELLALLRKQE
jgi:DNA-binding transcriptional MerR regulator